MGTWPAADPGPDALPPESGLIRATVVPDLVAEWRIPAGIRHALEAVGGVHPEGPDALPLAVLARGLAGDRASALAMARTLVDHGLSVNSRAGAATADLAACRLWAARMELRDDKPAFDAAKALLEEGILLDPLRRAMLHYGLGATMLESPVSVGVDGLDEAGRHFHQALALAQGMRFDEFTAAALSRLAALELPTGRITVADRVSMQALSIAPVRRDAQRMTRWQVRAALTQQWSRHYQGLEIDMGLLAQCLQVPAALTDPVMLPIRGATAALAAVEVGDVQRARLAVEDASADRRVGSLGLWRIPLIMLDAYLAVVGGDSSRVRTAISELTQLPAPAEALMIRAVQLAHAGDLRGAVAALRPVTSGSVHSFSITFPAACALEATLHAESGDRSAAEASMRQTLGATEPLNARRIFTLHHPATAAEILRGMNHAEAARGWATKVLDYVETYQGSRLAPVTITALTSSPNSNVAQAPVGPAAGETSAAFGGSPLTEREREVLALVSQGATQASMARELFVSLNTIKTHLRSIRQKLGVDRTGQAAAVARSAGWLDGEGGSAPEDGSRTRR
jgi:DNA-binding CsgD family transcriptional regulator